MAAILQHFDITIARAGVEVCARACVELCELVRLNAHSMFCESVERNSQFGKCRGGGVHAQLCGAAGEVSDCGCLCS